MWNLYRVTNNINLYKLWFFELYSIDDYFIITETTIEKWKPQWSATANLRERWKSLNPWNQTDSFCLSIIGRPSARDMRTSCLCKCILLRLSRSLDGLSYTCSIKSLNFWTAPFAVFHKRLIFVIWILVVLETWNTLETHRVFILLV